MFIAFAIIFVIAVLVTLYLCFSKKTEKKEDELLRIREITETVLLGVFLWAESIYLLYYAIVKPEILLTNSNSVINTSIFLVTGIFLGAYMILYGTVKCVVISSENITEVDAFGRRSCLRWSDIAEAKRTNGKRILLTSKDGARVSVGGKRKDVKIFIKLCDEYLTSRKAREVVVDLKNALKI